MILPNFLLIIPKYRSVMSQRDDFEVFKDSLQKEINKIKLLYRRAFRMIENNPHYSIDEKKVKVFSLEKKFDLDLAELKIDANTALTNSDADKKKQFETWRNTVPKIFIAWFVLITADTFTNVHLFFKYIALLGGMYMTWSSLIDISLFGQRASFARACLKNINRIRGMKFCYFDLSSKSFNNKNGLTRFYASTTSSHIRQHKRILFFLLIFIIFSLIWDFSSIKNWFFIHVWNIYF